MDLDDATKSENDFQKLVENGMDKFYPFWIQNHDVHMNMVLSKWHIADHLETDMTYITKSTDEWWIVFVEFEPPGINLTTASGQVSAELNKGIKQINDWRAHVDRYPTRVRDRLNRFLAPDNPRMNQNPVRYKYLLIAGRDHELADSRKRQQVASMGSGKLKIKSWDSMIENSSRYCTRLNVVSVVNDKCVFKNMNSVPPLMYMNPEEYVITAEQENLIKAAGHSYDKWKSGEKLCMAGGKYITGDKAIELIKSILGTAPNDG